MPCTAAGERSPAGPPVACGRARPWEGRDMRPGKAFKGGGPQNRAASAIREITQKSPYPLNPAPHERLQVAAQECRPDQVARRDLLSDQSPAETLLRGPKSVYEPFLQNDWKRGG